MPKHAIERLQSSVLALHPESLPRLVERLRVGVIVEEDREPCELEVLTYAPGSVRPCEAVKLPRVSGSIAVVPIRGLIDQRPSWMADTSTERVGAAIDALMIDASVGAIVLDIDSPGGYVTGTPELSEKIRRHRDAGEKPIYGLANSMAASAAYQIGAQVTKLFVTPSGEVGSIGVWMAHVDASKMLEDIGWDISLIFAGKYKVEGNPYEPLDDEARAAMQADVDAHYAVFLENVAKGRGVKVSDVKARYGEGRMLMAKPALAAGMVDGIATMQELLGAIVKPRDSRQRALKAAVELDLEEAG